MEELTLRFDVPEGASDRVERFALLSNWDHGNLVPESAPELPAPRAKLTETETRIASNHLLEALSALEIDGVRDARRMADLGSGAGFPGLVLAAALPDTRVTLVERYPHLSVYLRNAAADLGLENVEVEGGPVESWTEEPGAYDLVTSRKMGRPDTILGWIGPLLAPGGLAVLFYKERDAGSEALGTTAAVTMGLTRSAVIPVATTDRKGRVLTDRKHLHVFRKAA